MGSQTCQVESWLMRSKPELATKSWANTEPLGWLFKSRREHLSPGSAPAMASLPLPRSKFRGTCCFTSQCSRMLMTTPQSRENPLLANPTGHGIFHSTEHLVPQRQQQQDAWKLNDYQKPWHITIQMDSGERGSSRAVTGPTRGCMLPWATHTCKDPCPPVARLWLTTEDSWQVQPFQGYAAQAYLAAIQ